MENPLYYAADGYIWKRPVEKDGNVSMGFRVCELSDSCKGQEEKMAMMLNQAELHDDMFRALEKGKEALEMIRADSEAGRRISGRAQRLGYDALSLMSTMVYLCFSQFGTKTEE
jgi:hypothetical protein